MFNLILDYKNEHIVNYNFISAMAEDLDVEAMLEEPYKKNVSIVFFSNNLERYNVKLSIITVKYFVIERENFIVSMFLHTSLTIPIVSYIYRTLWY